MGRSGAARPGSGGFLSRRMVRVAALGGAIALAVGTFAAVTHQMVAGRGGLAVDRDILLWMAERRTPSFTAFLVGVTALGSPGPFTVVMLVVLAVLIALRDRWGALHLAVAGAGTWGLERAGKDLLERTRPTEVAPLIAASGYSYPSGHALAASALYLTIAIVAARHVRGRASKALLLGGAFLLVGAIALSRVYLGVHYPSDVVSGVALGTAWALLLAAAAGAIVARRPGGHPA